MPAALEGIRVLDLTQIMAGPFCAMLLADLGAEVIKIENPRGGDDSRRMAPPYYNGESAAFMAMNRNKYGIAVDIRAPAGKQALWRFIESADVLVENFRPVLGTRRCMPDIPRWCIALSLVLGRRDHIGSAEASTWWRRP
jgi:crotonobetainyl-CoA:carnitine CoA-transferase CaiB-like acyl-CoA transferase